MNAQSNFSFAFCALFAMLATTGPATAGSIFSPATVTATNSNDINFGVEQNLINQNGLINRFTSGVSDFDSYIAGNPQHSPGAFNSEWFTDNGFATSRLTFDLGAQLILNRLVVWNDEAAGVGTIVAAASTNGTSYLTLGTYSPTDWVTTVLSYGPDVFTFDQTAFRYLRLDVSGCPQPNGTIGGIQVCGLGEIAVALSAVPEPSPIVLALLACPALCYLANRRTTSRARSSRRVDA